MVRKEGPQTDTTTRAPGARVRGFVAWLRNLPLVGGNVVIAILIQLVGYAALSALVPHSEFAVLVEPLQRAPPVLLVPVAILAIPAIALAVAFGTLLAAVGLQPTTVLVVISAYVVSVAGLWVYRRLRHPEPNTYS